MEFKKARKNLDREDGFSLMELIVVIVVTGIIIVTTLPFFKIGVQSYVSVRSGKDMMQSARIGLNRMMAEMRLIESSGYIDYGYSDEIQFDLPGENNITYVFSDGQIFRESKILVDGVRSFTIRYYKADGSQKATPFWWENDIWRISVEMEVGDDESQMILTGQVSPRKFHI